MADVLDDAELVVQRRQERLGRKARDELGQRGGVHHELVATSRDLWSNHVDDSSFMASSAEPDDAVGGVPIDGLVEVDDHTLGLRVLAVTFQPRFAAHPAVFHSTPR